MANLTFTVNPADVERLVAKLGKATALGTLRAPFARSLALLQNDLATYPAPQPHAQPFRSDKARRFFFAALREGKITSPYRRTGNLGRAWTSQLTEGADALAGVVGNARSYGPFVQGEGRQSSYFQDSAWPTDAAVLAKRTPQIVTLFTEAIDLALR